MKKKIIKTLEIIADMADSKKADKQAAQNCLIEAIKFINKKSQKEKR